jgi:hypothetical protein
MKKLIMSAVLVVVLATTGATCINENIVIPLNVSPLSATITLTSGTTTTFNGSANFTLGSVVDDSYLGDLKGVQVYDVKVYVTGNYTNGKVNASTATVNGKTLFTFAGDWSAFKTPQSILGGSSLITSNATGVNELVTIFSQGSSGTAFTLGASGSVGPSPVPAGLQVTLEVYLQANAQVN